MWPRPYERAVCVFFSLTAPWRPAAPASSARTVHGGGLAVPSRGSREDRGGARVWDRDLEGGGVAGGFGKAAESSELGSARPAGQGALSPTEEETPRLQVPFAFRLLC
jgi:hypothetical protein